MVTRAWVWALGLAVAMLAGVIALGATEDAARGSDPEPLVWTWEVTVWRALDDGALYVGAREEDGLWRRHPAALDLSVTSASGRFHRSGIVAMTVPLAGFGEAVVEAVVWRSVADPSRLHLSVRREGERWRTVNEPLAMHVYEPSEWQRYERADAVTVEFAFPDSLPDGSVEGPLAVFTAAAGEAWTDAAGWGRAGKVYVLDTATDRYWRAFEYHAAWPGGVQLAGERFIVWDRERVRRVRLEGWDEAVLYEGAGISQVEVSPDGAKVAVLSGDGALTVLDAATGDALLRVESQTELAALLPDASTRTFTLEGWNAASDRLAVAVNAPMGESRTGIFTLDGALRLLPPNAGNLSPDFRYAIQPHGEGCRYGWTTWPGFDVIEAESGRTVRTVTASERGFVALRDDTYQPGWQWLGWWAAPDHYAWHETYSGCSAATERASDEGAVAASTTYLPSLDIPISAIPLWEEDAGGTRVEGYPAILDIASGETERPAPAAWYRLRMEAARLHGRGCAGRSAQSCSLVYEGRPVWKNGVVEAVGIIELAEPLALFAVRLLDSPRPSPNPPPPPPSPEWAGPLLAWSEDGGYERVTDADDGGERFLPLRRVMVYDEGTGRSWRAFDYRFRDEEPAVWPAHGGFVVRVGGTVRYVTPDGQSRLLLTEDRDNLGVHVSPSGGNVIVSFRTARPIDVTLALFALPSGEEILRVDSGEPRFDDHLRELRHFWSQSAVVSAFGAPAAFIPLAWNTDETAFSIAFSTGFSYGDEPGGVLHLNGEFTPLPPDAEFGPPAESPTPASERASVRCGAERRCSVLLDGEVVGEGRWAEAIGFVALD